MYLGTSAVKSILESTADAACERTVNGPSSEIPRKLKIACEHWDSFCNSLNKVITNIYVTDHSEWQMLLLEKIDEASSGTLLFPFICHPSIHLFSLQNWRKVKNRIVFKWQIWEVSCCYTERWHVQSLSVAVDLHQQRAAVPPLSSFCFKSVSTQLCSFAQSWLLHTVLRAVISLRASCTHCCWCGG